MAKKDNYRNTPKTVADFFAGIGLVSLGLKDAGWDTVYALDYDLVKEKQYTDNFGVGHYQLKDIATEKGENVPAVTLAHASFPCTDLSLAGARRGIHQGESSAFWEFARVLGEMQEIHGDANPPLVLLENVEGLITSNKGEDLHVVLQELNKLGYKTDLLRVDASHFVPQSRVRIFIIGIHKTLVEGLGTSQIQQEFNLHSSDSRTQKIISYISKYDDIDWYFHRLPSLPSRSENIESIVDPNAEWWTTERTERLYNQLHDRQRDIIDNTRNEKGYKYYPAFRRMRMRNGKSQSTIEFRTDGIAGCLRTPKGGSARQIIIRVGNGSFNARLINAREAACLMGAPNFVIDPSLSLNQALFGFGDAVCATVLQWIGDNYFNELVDSPESVSRSSVVLDQIPVLGF